jgi:prepilin-type N-terminal cleavage/methylation domain-containing protein
MRRSAGFSMIEILVAVAIAGIIGLVAYRLLANTQELSAMMRGRNDAERQTLLLLQQVNNHYLQKKPGGIIGAKKVTEETFLRDYACDKTLTPQQRLTDYKPYSFTLHHDTEDCLVKNFPTLLVGCKGISIAKGVWTVKNGNGCSDEKNYSVFSAISKCQKINAPGGSPFNDLDFTKPNLAKKAMTECTKCRKGERPIVIINHYAIPSDASSPYASRRPNAINEWRLLPDGNLSLVAGSDGKIGSVGQSLQASKRKDFKKYSFLSSSAVGLELCTHLDGDSVLIDVNGFYVQRVTGSDGRDAFDLRKVKQQTSYPKEVISNQDFRYMP